MTWEDACRKLGLMPISVTGKFERGLSSTGVGGCQFAEVAVDIETGVVKLKKIVAVQDTGLILDMLTWKSQIYGGVIGGLNYGMFEERIMDEQTGRCSTPTWSSTSSPAPPTSPRSSSTPTTPPRCATRRHRRGRAAHDRTAAAIGNAVANAIGVRVPDWPMSPMNVLNALARRREGVTP